MAPLPGSNWFCVRIPHVAMGYRDVGAGSAVTGLCLAVPLCHCIPHLYNTGSPKTSLPHTRHLCPPLVIVSLPLPSQ